MDKIQERQEVERQALALVDKSQKMREKKMTQYDCFNIIYKITSLLNEGGITGMDCNITLMLMEERERVEDILMGEDDEE